MLGHEPLTFSSVTHSLEPSLPFSSSLTISSYNLPMSIVVFVFFFIVGEKKEMAQLQDVMRSTWSPRLRPASAALLPGSTFSMKMRKPFSEPPSRLKARGASRDGLVRVTTLSLALAAQAMFNSLKCPNIFCFNTQEQKDYCSLRSVNIVPKTFVARKDLFLLNKKKKHWPPFPDCSQTLRESASFQGRPRSHWSDCSPTARLPV